MHRQLGAEELVIVLRHAVFELDLPHTEAPNQIDVLGGKKRKSVFYGFWKTVFLLQNKMEMPQSSNF